MLQETQSFVHDFEKSGLDLDEAERELGYSTRQIKRFLAAKNEPPKLVVDRVRQIARSRTPKTISKPEFRFIDLFAGIGGFRLGFEAIGGKCVFSSEWDRFSQKTYLRNFPDGDDHIFAGDIKPYGDDPALVPEHDVLLAGFPCQPFSLAGVSKKNSLGRKHGFDDEKQGNMFFHLASIIKHHNPPRSEERRVGKECRSRWSLYN